MMAQDVMAVKRLLALLLMAALLLSAAFCSVNAVSRSGTYYGADGSGGYYVSFRGSHADISLFPSGISSSVDLSYDIAAVSAGGGRIVMLSNDVPNDMLIVQIYEPTSNYFDSYAINELKAYENNAFCYDGDDLYIADNQKPNTVKRYDIYGSLANTYTFPNSVSQLFFGYDDMVYAVSRGTLYRLNGSFQALGGDTVSTPLSPIDSDYVGAPDGSVYDIWGNTVDYLFTADNNAQPVVGCTIGNIIYYPDGNVINGYDSDTGEKVCTYRANGDIRLLYADGQYVTAVTNDGQSFSIHQNSFTRIEKQQGNQSNQSQSNLSGTKTNDIQNTDDDSGISSDTYRVDLSRYQISGIRPGTSVSTFKKNMRYNGYSLQIFRDDTEKTSGTVGTAWTAVFSNSKETITFELSVNGDLTGEGSCNSRDLTILMDYLIGKVSFDGVYELSADIDHDNRINAVDLALLKRSI